MWLKAGMKTSGLHTEAWAELALIFLEKENIMAVKRILNEIYITSWMFNPKPMKCMQSTYKNFGLQILNRFL